MTEQTTPKPPPLPAESIRRTRFSLRALLLGVTAFAVWCVLVAELPHAFSQTLVGLAWIAGTGWLITGLFFAQGDQRAFCIGAAVVVSSMWTGIGGRFLQGAFQIFGIVFGWRFSDEVTLWLDLGLIAAVAIANGWFCVQARRYFERHP